MGRGGQADRSASDRAPARAAWPPLGVVRFDEALTASTEASELRRAAPLGGGDAAAVLEGFEARRARSRAHERWVE
jgi:hypothetical protein